MVLQPKKLTKNLKACLGLCLIWTRDKVISALKSGIFCCSSTFWSRGLFQLQVQIRLYFGD